MKTVEHLIETFVPENYNIFLDINRQTKTFTGNVAINGEALDNHVAFHQKDLDIKSILLDNEAVMYQVDNDNEVVRVELPETGMMTLVIEFSGHITDNMTGIYPSYYTKDGEKKEVISTQFESHFAREAFPCIDEPQAKATFDLSLTFDQEAGDIALSNMPEINVERRQETGLWTFDTTPRMSSYLLAFALGNLHGKTVKSKRGTTVGAYATTAHPLSSLDFSLDIAVRVIDFYEDYFGVHYPIPQSLNLALPDFSSGAMENWGLITYREIYLLVDENSTAQSRQQVALVVAHEIAHQWFGNLVTMKWWDDLWLNESFANMMEYVSIDAIEPSWKIFEDFQTGGVPLALKRDATDGVQSVHVDVSHPDEINTLFDPAIVYAKGSRLMHMLRRWIGDRDFAAGLRLYFEKHQYRNTIGRDLWNALSDASGKDVAAFMDAWLEQPGYPVLTARLENDQLILSQKQFFIGEAKDHGRLWPIPLNSNWKGLPETLTEAEMVIPNFSQLAAENEGALRFNTENTAHYITDYQGPLLAALVTELAHLDNTSALQAIQERRLLADSGLISYAELVDLIAQLDDSKSYMVAEAVQQVVSGLKRFVDEGSLAEKSFNRLVTTIYQEDFNQHGFEKKADESDEDEMVRQVALGRLWLAENPAIIDGLRAIFETYTDNIASIPAAVRRLVLANQMKHFETDSLVDTYFDTYVATTDNNLRNDLTVALGQTSQSATLKRILVSLKDKDIIKPQDLSFWYNVLLGQSFTQETIWEWARENWEWIKAALGGDMSFDKFVIYPAANFKTQERLNEYKAFFEPKLDDMAISRNIAMGINEIEARVALITKEKAAVLEALSHY
ncbi:UNVERIFIED_CONTAM: M1 family metallopeptidase [Streptococcus canis]|uniref:M1 family metallopeptidase n=1 Tax=Streptococcus canis TaxID=1329 RepID=UPI000B8A949C|nr:M1 family metallopeptidase [Streptococcus canis]MDW7796948.1 M1 family metallopeptidase [Streptococcus canis]QJD12370.1 M1 family metallopeptidase [Streptococcus canis]VTR80043.1 lysyl aminopeptidase/alanine aminopeptidase [Streptococcus canis]GFG47832.1 putative lysyl-aminopeptidase; aminopeptidase N [Streptococcus canis]GMX34991.1 M1 family metallopeptidase [Streptococcus canis]